MGIHTAITIAIIWIIVVIVSGIFVYIRLL